MHHAACRQGPAQLPGRSVLFKQAFVNCVYWLKVNWEVKVSSLLQPLIRHQMDRLSVVLRMVKDVDRCGVRVNTYSHIVQQIYCDVHCKIRVFICIFKFFSYSNFVLWIFLASQDKTRMFLLFLNKSSKIEPGGELSWLVVSRVSSRSLEQ